MLGEYANDEAKMREMGLPVTWRHTKQICSVSAVCNRVTNRQMLFFSKNRNLNDLCY